MKLNKLIITGLAVAALAVSALAVSSTFTYTRASGYGSPATGPATVIIPAVEGRQIRVINVNYGSDTNTAAIAFQDGGAAYSITATNQATSSVTNQVNTTNGLSASLVVLQHAGVCYTNTITAWNSSTNAGPYGGTNIVLATGGFGVATSVGDNLYVLNTAVQLPVGATTNVVNGEALFVTALTGRPLLVQIPQVSVTNRLFNVTVHYD